MLQCYAKSNIGYSHVLNKKPCQDYSALYKDNNRTIITCCDGHGGEIYIRSDIGSHMASNAVINIFNSINKAFFYNLTEEEIENKIKLYILCEWNKLVEQSYSSKSFKKNELEKLSEDQKDILKMNPSKAYGTTLTGALLFGNKLLVVGIGDTECLYLKKGQVLQVFEDENEPVANITYSMCQEDAYKYIKVKILDFKSIDGVILCTDGLTSPYQSYDNFKKSFIAPTIKKIVEDKDIQYIDNFIEKLALNLGVGDDVSLSFIINDKLTLKHYE